MGFGSLRCWNKFGFACLLRGMLAHPSARLYPQSPPRAMGPASGRTKLTSVRVVSSKWTRGTPSCWTAFGFWWGWSQPGSNLDLGLSSAILQPFSEGLLRELNFGRSTFSSLLLKTLTHSLSNTGRHSGNSKEFAWWKNMRYQASLLLKMESYYTWDRLKCKCRSQYLQSQPWHINSSLFNKHFTKLNIAIAIMPLVKNRTITNFKISNIGTTEPQTQTWNIAVMSQQASAWHRQGGFGAFGSIACLDFWSDQGASSCTTFHISLKFLSDNLTWANAKNSEFEISVSTAALLCSQSTTWFRFRKTYRLHSFFMYQVRSRTPRLCRPLARTHHFQTRTSRYFILSSIAPIQWYPHFPSSGLPTAASPHHASRDNQLGALQTPG